MLRAHSDLPVVLRGEAFDCIDARVLAAMGAFRTGMLVEESAAGRDGCRQVQSLQMVPTVINVARKVWNNDGTAVHMLC